jgi:hypothetical protein
MPKPPTLSPTQHASITSALFRREETSTIARDHSISERQVRRIAQNLRTHGTVSAPRTKKMGRPNVLTKEIEDDLREYVGANPMALLSDMQKYIAERWEVKVSRASLSRRMKELGFTRGVVKRAMGEAPALSQVDFARLLGGEGLGEGGLQVQGNGPVTQTKYAWLLDGEPVPRREVDGSAKKRRGMVGSGKGHRGKNDMNISIRDESNIDDSSIQPDLETATNAIHEGQLELDILGNVASHSEYAMPLGQQQHQIDTTQQAIDSELEQSNFHPLRQHLPPYLPPLERQGHVSNPFQPSQVDGTMSFS